MKPNVKLLSALCSVALLSSCSAGQLKGYAFVAPSKLNPDIHAAVDYAKALAAYGSFASKTVKSSAMRSQSNTVYSPLSHYLCEATLASLLINAEETTLNSLGASSVEELISYVDKLVKAESLVTDDPNYYGVVEMANLVANFESYWPKEKVDLITGPLHAAYLDDYKNREPLLTKWKEDLSKGKTEIPTATKLDDNSISFISGLYIDLLYELALNETPEIAPFNGKGQYPFLKGYTYGCLYEDEEVVAFSQACRSNEYEIRYIMPKDSNLDEYIEGHDYAALFDKVSSKGKYAFELPSVSISNEWSLSKLDKSSALPSQSSYIFLPDDMKYDKIDATQSIELGFKYDGVKAYAESKIVVIPESAPAGSVKLNQPFAFEIVGRGDACLLHGRLRTLDS